MPSTSPVPSNPSDDSDPSRFCREHPFLSSSVPRAFAHRGWHIGDTAGMENSLGSFRAAAEAGYRYVETDVHATSDGEVVLSHDPTLDRTTDGTGAIADQPWSQVRKARITGAHGSEPVATLRQALTELPELCLNIDVKADSAAIPTVGLLDELKAWDRVALAAFSELRLRRIRRIAGPGMLSSMSRSAVAALWASSRRLGPPLPAPGRLAQVPASFRGATVVDSAMIRKAHRQGREVHVWTVDEPEEMCRLLELGVDGLMTDRPDRLREVLTARDQWPPG